MMRSCLPDLDPEGTAEDLIQKRHDMSLLREKWDEVVYTTDGENAVRVRFRCDFEGSISERCMELAALDRVLYNLVNNARRFTADERVDIDVLPLEEAPTTVLRFAVSNAITAEQYRRLADCFERRGRLELHELFLGGFTTGGHGHGLRICTDLVAHGFGLSSPQEAVETGYVGATLLDEHFVAWFHWIGEH
jgi:signal transduction histidine kinase